MENLKNRKAGSRIRMALMIFILALMTALGVAHQKLAGSVPAGVDALCPFGAIESAYMLIATGAVLKRVAVSSFILLAAVMLAALLFRRAFCGLICPLGTLQELFAAAGKKILGRQFLLPAALDRPARYLKYIVLALVIVLSAVAGELVIRPYDPWVAYSHLTSGELLSEFEIGLYVLLLTLAGSFFYNRVFCKYLCPMGAFLAFFSKLGWFGISRSRSACLGCKACNRACPVQVDVASSVRISDPECISCYECVNVCPSREALYVTGPRFSLRPGAGALTVAVAGVFALVVGLTTLSGDFRWESPSLSVTVESAGIPDPELIKGRMTLQEVADAYGIPGQVFMERFKLDPTDLNAPIRDIAAKYGMSETDEVREFVREYLSSINQK